MDDLIAVNPRANQDEHNSKVLTIRLISLGEKGMQD